MLNLEKESFIDNIVLKHSFKMVVMSVKNLVYNKLTRQNIFFVLLVQFRFWLFWLTDIIIYILILFVIIVTIAFIILSILLLYFIVIIVIIIIVLMVINAIYSILPHFISCCSYYYDFCLCVACDVHVSSRIFFPLFLLMIYIL